MNTRTIILGLPLGESRREIVNSNNYTTLTGSPKQQEKKRYVKLGITLDVALCGEIIMLTSYVEKFVYPPILGVCLT